MKVKMNVIMRVELTLNANNSGNECDHDSWNKFYNEFGINFIFDIE